MIDAVEKTKVIDGQFFTANEIIKKYKSLVHLIAHKYQKSITAVMGYEDLVSAGNIGLWKAYEGFDQTKGFKFMSYAYAKIKGEIQRLVRDHNPGLNFPREIKSWSGKVGSESTAEEIAEQLGIPLEKAYEVVDYKKNRYTAWIEYPISEDKKKTVADILPQYEDFSEMYVNEFMTFLKSENERLYHVALLTIRDKQQRVIGEKIGVSQVQVGRYIKKIQNLYEVFNVLSKEKVG